MYAFAVLGDEAEPALERLLEALEGRVGVVRVDDGGGTGGATETDGSGRVDGAGGMEDGQTDDPRSHTTASGSGAAGGRARAATTVHLDEGWRATGEARSLADALDRLAPDHEYAAVLGAPDANLPAVVVGGEPQGDDGAGPGQVVAASAAATGLDVEATVAAIRETEPHETLESLVAAVKDSSRAEYAGAIATFTGRVREREGPDDARTHYLEFEAYEALAPSRMRAIETELAERDGVQEVRLHHRTGRVHAGEDIVFVVVLAGHRREAFRAVEDGIDRLKEEVPIFKREVTGEDSFWVHERDA